MSSADPVYDGSGVDPIEDARMHYQAIHGEKPPVTPEEANSRNHGVTTDHPYDSIMEEAELGVAEAFDASGKIRKRISNTLTLRGEAKTIQSPMEATTWPCL